MDRRSLSLISILAFTLLLIPNAHSQTAQKPCTAGITFWKLLEEVGVGYEDGRLGLGPLYAVCLPTPSQKSTSNYPYDPDGGGKLSTVVKTSNGKVLNTYVWYARSIGDLWEMSRYKVLGGYEAVKPLAAGSYLLEFAIDDKPFYRFPFSIVVAKNDDPYQPAGDRYFMEGAWSEYGNIYYQRNDPTSILTFTTFVQEKGGSQNKTPVPYEIKLVSSRDGRVLASETGALRLQPRWLKAALYFRHGADKAFFRAGDLLSGDGRYVIQLTINNKPYGHYPFVVKGGRIELQGKQIRESTDPMVYIIDYLSGGRYTSWWIKREPAAK